MKKILLTIGTIITIALALSGTYYVSQGDDAFYCESRNIVMLCEKLSSGIGTRCYYEDTYKVCQEGWVKIELEQQLENNLKSKQIICDQKGCVPI